MFAPHPYLRFWLACWSMSWPRPRSWLMVLTPPLLLVPIPIFCSILNPPAPIDLLTCSWGSVRSTLVGPYWLELGEMCLERWWGVEWGIVDGNEVFDDGLGSLDIIVRGLSLGIWFVSIWSTGGFCILRLQLANKLVHLFRPPILDYPQPDIYLPELRARIIDELR